MRSSISCILLLALLIDASLVFQSASAEPKQGQNGLSGPKGGMKSAKLQGIRRTYRRVIAPDAKAQVQPQPTANFVNEAAKNSVEVNPNITVETNKEKPELIDDGSIEKEEEEDSGNDLPQDLKSKNEKVNKIPYRRKSKGAKGGQVEESPVEREDEPEPEPAEVAEEPARVVSAVEPVKEEPALDDEEEEDEREEPEQKPSVAPISLRIDNGGNNMSMVVEREDKKKEKEEEVKEEKEAEEVKEKEAEKPQVRELERAIILEEPRDLPPKQIHEHHHHHHHHHEDGQKRERKHRKPKRHHHHKKQRPDNDYEAQKFAQLSPRTIIESNGNGSPLVQINIDDILRRPSTSAPNLVLPNLQAGQLLVPVLGNNQNSPPADSSNQLAEMRLLAKVVRDPVRRLAAFDRLLSLAPPLTTTTTTTTIGNNNNNNTSTSTYATIGQLAGNGQLSAIPIMFNGPNQMAPPTAPLVMAPQNQWWPTQWAQPMIPSSTMPITLPPTNFVPNPLLQPANFPFNPYFHPQPMPMRPLLPLMMPQQHMQLPMPMPFPMPMPMRPPNERFLRKRKSKGKGKKRPSKKSIEIELDEPEVAEEEEQKEEQVKVEVPVQVVTEKVVEPKPKVIVEQVSPPEQVKAPAPTTNIVYDYVKVPRLVDANGKILSQTSNLFNSANAALQKVMQVKP